MDHSRRACPDHPCDRCAICRSGRCCQNDSPRPLASSIDQLTDVLFGAVQLDRERTLATSTPAIEAPAEPTKRHTIAWVASEPSAVPEHREPAAPTAEEAIRERERRTRERWAQERAQQARVDVHHHAHHTPTPSGVSDDDIVDAEVVDDSDEPRLPGGIRGALPPGSPPDLTFTNQRDKEVRRRDQ